MGFFFDIQSCMIIEYLNNNLYVEINTTIITTNVGTGNK